MDGVSYLDFDDDLEYNAIWESAVSIDENGWNLEYKCFAVLSRFIFPWPAVGPNTHQADRARVRLSKPFENQ